MPELATPEEVLASCYETRPEVTSDRTIYWCIKCRAYAYSGINAIPHQEGCLVATLAASQERVRELGGENVALRANTSASVVRRLVEQGALRGPETPA